MQKLLCIILSITILLYALPTSFAADKSGRAVAVSDFETNAHEFTADESHELVFTVHIVTDNGQTANPSVYDDNGKKITRLYDDATHGDKKACDGIYTAVIKTKIAKTGTFSYHVEADGLKSKEQDVTFYHMLTTRELVMHEKFWAAEESYRQSLRKAGKTPAEILTLMYDYCKSSDIVDASTLDYADEHSITFRFTFGTTGCIDEYAPSVNDERAFDGVVSLQTANTENVSWEDPDFMVFRPFRRTQNAGQFDNEFYTGIASSVCDITGGEMHDYQEQDAYPGNLKKICDYGFFFIDSHGTEANGKSYMMIRRGDASQYDYAADLSAGHIIASGENVGVTGSFFTKYIKDEGKTMPGTLLYLAICFGMSTDSICNPALDCGAQLVYGYTDSVSFAWDFEISESIWEYMLTAHPEHPERSYTFNEALEAAMAEHGSIDPYSTGTAPQSRNIAEPRTKGNTDFLLLFNGYMPVDSFNITSREYSLYTAETAKIEYEVTGEGVMKYGIAFSSDNDSIASVDENGIITMQDEGTAIITAILTDLAYAENPRRFTDTCKVTGLGYLKAEGIFLADDYIEVYESEEGRRVNAHVLPENATDKLLRYECEKENVVTVSEDGIITPLSVGHTKITISHPDTDETAVLECRVLPYDLSVAINAKGGDLALQNSPTYPFVPAFDEDGLPCAKSTNQGVDSSLSWIKTSGGQMQEGSTFSFDWRVSSQEKADMLIFYVNDQKIQSISGETGWENVTYTVPADGEYTFRISYMKDANSDANADTGCVRNMELYKAGEKHTVFFYDMDGETLIASVETEHGKAATPPEAPIHAGYTFYNWSRSTERVLSDLDVFAIYDWTAMPGDVNADGKISTSDATYILKAAAGMLSLCNEQTVTADVSRDGTVDTLDAVCILKYLVGNIAEL